MKKTSLFLIIICICAIMQAKTVNVAIAGKLSTYFSEVEKNTVTDLTVTGTIDARDFKFIRDTLINIKNIDMGNVTIAGYTGSYGTLTAGTLVHDPNAIPDNSFQTTNNNTGRSTLESIILPISCTKIGYYAFSYCRNLKNIVIPANVTIIDNNAFESCIGLESITLNSKLIKIGWDAFSDCILLTSITLPNSLEIIGISAFYNCKNLLTINLPNSIKEINSSAFSNCTSLQSIVLPDSLTYFSDYVFSNCSSLSSVQIPSNINNIPVGTFYGCTALTSITIPNNINSIKAGAFEGCSGLTSVSIPNSVYTIESRAFEGCSGLSSLTIPASVTSLHNLAYRGYIIVDPSNNYYSSENGILYNKNKTVLLEYPNNKIGVYVMPNTVKKITSYAFSSCNNIESITFSSNLDTIADYSFTLSNINSLVIPSSVRYINNFAFYNSKIITLRDASKLNSIEKSTYEGCTLMTSMNIPSSVTSIAERVYKNCSSLKYAIIPANVTSIGREVFKYCIGLQAIYAYPKTPVDLSASTLVFTNVNKPDFTLYVPIGSKSAYQSSVQWKDFTNIVEFDSIKTLHINITAGNLATSINKLERETTTNLTLTGTIDVRDIIYMRDSMPILSKLDLKDVTIDGFSGLVDTVLFRSTSAFSSFSANTLPKTAFKNKATLSTIILPKTLTEIQNDAFMGCFNLDTIQIFNNVPIDLSAKLNVFELVDTNTCALKVPYGTTPSYSTANEWEKFINIIEMKNSTISNINNEKYTKQNPTTSLNNGILSISTLNVGENISIYNALGSEIVKLESVANTFTTKLPSHGVYIVKINNFSTKVIY